GNQSALFSNPGITDPSTDQLTYRRGGDFADWYFTFGVTLGITIGEAGGGGGRGKTGCYQF
ncbi:MAG: hypothetical protein AAF828_12330, partial [Bacteroidota bacterium]